MRNPTLHKSLGRPMAEGLSNMLTGSIDLEAAIQPSPSENLWVMMAGHIPPNPAELLSSGEINRIIGEASARFDYVILDGPPILGLADAPLLSRAVEANVLVVESDRTRATQARHALERLFAVRANVIGAVLTKFDAHNAGYGYGYGYGYDYGSSSGDR
jgi:capsular exopolysaccharide synthesis family protein